MRKSMIILACICTQLAFAQIPEMPKSVLSPNAASFATYGEVPVSTFTGIPQVEIPLYTVQVGNYSFPITLSYHASGVRPDQRPGWVGVGWNLNTGGIISRVVNDIPDDFCPRIYGERKPYGFYHNPNTGAFNQNSDFGSIINASFENGVKTKDTQSDEYSFSFYGYTGKFFLTSDKKWQVKCDRPVTIELLGSDLMPPFETRGYYFGNAYDAAHTLDYSTSFNGFALTTEDGTQYIFGGNDESMDFNMDFMNQNSAHWFVSAWYLTKIILPNHDEITFRYRRKEFICQLYYNYTSTSVEYSNDWTHVVCGSKNFNNESSRYQGQLISPVYLENMATPYESVYFNSQVSYQLNYSDEIFSKMGSQQFSSYFDNHKKFPFLEETNATSFNPSCFDKMKWYQLYGITSSNFDANNAMSITIEYSRDTTLRLHLKKLKFMDHTYQFEYDNIENLPPYLSQKTDHWGFFNNRVQSGSTYAQSKEPQAPYMLYGLLSKIIWPTKGYTRFVYEPHTYRKELQRTRWQIPLESYSTNKMAGGARIKQIINSADSIDEVIAKEYYYTTDFLTGGNNTSSGILGGKSEYDLNLEMRDGNSVMYIGKFSSQTALPGSNNSCGCHIGYSDVIEKNSDNSFIHYHYSNFDNGYMDEAPISSLQESATPYQPYTSRSDTRGKLLLQEEYSSTHQLKKKTTFTYNTSDDGYVDMVDIKFLSVSCNIDYIYPMGTIYKQYTHTNRLVQKIESIYDGSYLPMVRTTSYSYGADSLLFQVSHSSGDEERITQYLRVSSSEDAICEEMKNKHILSPITSQIEKIKIGATTKNLQELNCTYQKKGTDKVMYLPYMVSSYMYANGNKVLTKNSIYEQYDATGNLTSFIDNYQTTIFIWDPTERYIVAKIENATYEEVLSVIGSFDTFGIKKEQSDLQVLRERLPNAHVTTYTYTIWGDIESITDEMGNTSTYTYNNHKLVQVKRKYGEKEQVVEAFDYNYIPEPPKPIIPIFPIE